MKRFWLGAALFLVVLTAALPIVNLVVPQKASAAGFHSGVDNDPDNFKLSAKVIDGAHIQVTASGSYDMNDGSKINVGPLLSGMYYDRNIGDNWGRTDNSSDANYAQGGDKKVGVTDGCQSAIRISFKEFIDLDDDYNQYMDNNKIASNIAGIYFKFQISTKGTNATGCIKTDYFSYYNPWTLLEDKENFNIGYFFTSFSETPVNDELQIKGGTISESDNDGVYDSESNGKYTATYSTGSDFKFNSDHPHWGGRCPNFITVGSTGRLANTRAGTLKDQDNADDNGCKLTDGDGNPRKVLILSNKPSEIVKGNTDPNPAGDDDTVGQIYNDKCPIDTWGLKWIVCPIIEAINSAIEKMSESVQDYITVDSKSIFENPAVNKAIDSIRIMSISALVAAAVFMVVAQASGMAWLDAYTLKKRLPELGIAIGLIVLITPLMYWFSSVMGAISHWIVDIVYAPFTELGNAKAADGWTILTTIGTGGALFVALGPFGLISLLITAFLSILVAIAVITIIKMGVVLSAIGMSAFIAMRPIPGMDKVSKMGIGVFVGGHVFPLLFGLAVAGGKIAAVLFPGTGIIKSIGSTFAILAPYWFAKAIAQASIGALGVLTGKFSDTTRGLFDSQRNKRKQIMQGRKQEFREGALYRNRGLGRAINNVGRRINVGKAGNFGFGNRGKAALQMQTSLDQKSAMERNRWMADLANDDRANAVLGLSGGSDQGMRQAARDIFTNDQGVYDERGAELAMQKARAAAGGKVDRASAAAALQTMAQNKSRAIGAGRADIVDRGIERLAGGNQIEADSLRYGYEYNSRNAGRGDLGGDWHGGAVTRLSNQLATADAATFGDPNTGGANAQAIAVANAMDGMGRTTVPQMMNGHTNQARANTNAIRNVLAHGDADSQMTALYRANEIAKNLSSANGDSQAEYTRFLENDLNLDTGSSVPLSQQLAARHLGLAIPQPTINATTGRASYTAAQQADLSRITELTNRIENNSRAYGNAMAYQGGQAAAADNK